MAPAWLKLRSSPPDIHAMFALHLPTALRAPRSTLSLPGRAEVRPPSLRHAPASPLQRLVFWLLAPSPLDAAPPLTRLPRVRRDFADSLGDVGGNEARLLAERASAAHTLRELWHLRADVYRLVAVQHSQAEAEQRLAALNRHFARRAPRAAAAAGA